MDNTYKTRIIAFIGKKQSGKDTSCQFLINVLNERINHLLDIKPSLDFPHNWNKDIANQYSFAFALKNFGIEVFGFTYNQMFGTNEEKNEYSQNIMWRNIPLPFDQKVHLYKSIPSRAYKEGIPFEQAYLTGREWLQIFGSEICREMWADCWAQNTILRIGRQHPRYALISDARFPNEIKVLLHHNHPNIHPEPIFLKLCRNPLNDKHFSETALDNFDFSFIKHFYLIDNINLSQQEKEQQILTHLDWLINNSKELLCNL